LERVGNGVFHGNIDGKRLNRAGITSLIMTNRLLLLSLLLMMGGSALAQEAVESISGVRAVLRPRSYHVSLGLPVWVQVSLENTTDEPITLTVPGVMPDLPLAEQGLPMSHIFSGKDGTGFHVTTESGRLWEKPLGYHQPTSAPLLILAPHSSVGGMVNLRQHYSALNAAGEFRVAWQPYGGAIKSDTVVITIAPHRRAELVTDLGTMTIEFYYDDAPKNVSNFIELVDQGFYNNKSFFRIEPGYLAQAGCPIGNGTGIRPDGKMVPAEFNSRPHEKGSVSMALLEGDPNSASCQFFICYSRQKDWDGKYTVFGHLVGSESYQTLDRLMEVEVDDRGRPKKKVLIRSARLINAPSDSVTDLQN